MVKKKVVKKSKKVMSLYMLSYICYNSFIMNSALSGFLDMTTPVTFLQETYDELKKVVWPTRDEVIRLTGAVTLISILVGLYIGALDYIFAKLIALILK